ncbi:cytochrome c and c1 heme-lyase [Trichodelitschia bisporula]|uniref:Holocytochrome c-type synthase n=1 Tax=Trichodelitschia bisporula TaxID=703511 RepID=A0A6G1HT97_9PEZI|nr:cytochrome c and c1 heme-lyase [Trichodelitschia bisporula]
MASEDACPVDHKTRAAWLEQAAAQKAAGNPAPPPHPAKPAPPPLPAGQTCDSSAMDQTPAPSHTASSLLASLRLGTQREVSTIPRAAGEGASAAPANAEAESGKDKSGMWIYPSEQMFFEAMRRKSYDPKAEDMRAIVPIHNAVNERAWREILGWEKGRGGEGCGGPKLASFSGNSQALTPKARINTLLGYQAPFDRHDWVVDRCGTRVEYVIDFYAGRDEGKPGKSLNFYLDVRPKLNTWEGWKMRVGRFVGA